VTADRPAQVEGAEAVPAGDGVVVYGAGALHTLNAGAAAIWSRCTGGSTVDEIVADLAATYAVPVDAMRDDVVSTLAGLRERGLLAGEDRAPGKPVLEPVPTCAACGPGPEYERHVVVDLGASWLTIGADAEVAAALVRVLGTRVVTVVDAPVGRPSYGVVVPAPVTDPIRPLARLHRGPDVLVRAREPVRVVRALLSLVSLHEQPPPLVLDAVAVGAGGRAVLMAPPARPVAFAREAARAGLAVADLAVVAVDPVTRRARIGPATPFDLAPLDGVLAARPATGTDPPTLDAGDYAVAALAVTGPPTALTAFAELAPLLVDVPAPLAPVHELVTTVPVRTATTVADVAAILAG
jgi:hypothetical protein